MVDVPDQPDRSCFRKFLYPFLSQPFQIQKAEGVSIPAAAVHQASCHKKAPAGLLFHDQVGGVGVRSISAVPSGIKSPQVVCTACGFVTIDCDLMIVIAFARSMQPDKTFAAGLPPVPDDLIHGLIALVVRLFHKLLYHAVIDRAEHAEREMDDPVGHRLPGKCEVTQQVIPLNTVQWKSQYILFIEDICGQRRGRK